LKSLNLRQQTVTASFIPIQIMESTITLPYYKNAKGWVSDLESFKAENTFLNTILDECFLRLSGTMAIDIFKRIGKKLRKLEADSNYSDTILSEQFKNLELVKKELIPENIVGLASKQMELEYLITSMNNEYREVKKELSLLLDL
jgi:hypothetical protein